MKLKLLTNLLASLGLAMLFPLTAAAQTEITVQYALPVYFKDAMAKIAEDFTKQNPSVKVKFLIPAESYSDLLQKTLRGSLGSDMPDVTFQSAGYLRTLVDRGVVRELSPFITGDKAFSSRGDNPALLGLGRIDGKQYAIPFATSVPLIYYNADLLRKAGGDPARFPRTWDGVFEVAGRMAALPGMDAGIQMPFELSPDWYWQVMVNSFGGTLVDDASGKIRFDGPEGRSAILAIEKMRDVGKMRSMDWASSRQSFFAGKVGMLVASSASLNQFERSISSRFSWDVATIPLQGDKARYTAGGNMAVIHSTDAAKQKAAWEFVDFATGPVGSTHQVKMVGYLPTNQMIVSSPAHLAGFYASNPKYAKSAEVVPLLTPWYAYRGENGLKIVDLIRKSLAGITEKKANPEQTLKELTGNVQALLPAK